MRQNLVEEKSTCEKIGVKIDDHINLISNQ